MIHRIWKLFVSVLVLALVVLGFVVVQSVASATTPVTMTGYNTWPAGFTKGIQAFEGGVFDGTSIWMIPKEADRVIKINPSDGSMTGYNTWPAGFTLTYSSFSGGVYDGTSIWMIPFTADSVIKINPSDGSMTAYNTWPAGFTKGASAFKGGVYDGTSIWMIPFNADRVIKIDTNTGAMMGYNTWPAGFTKGNLAFANGVYDGTSIWMFPQNANRVIKINPSDGSMTGYNTWPAGFTKSTGAFMSGVYDGTSIWMIPDDADRVIKINPSDGSMTGYNAWPTGFSSTQNYKFRGGVYDGTSIWMIPHAANRVIKMNPSDGSMTEYNTWPTGFTKGNFAFYGGVDDSSGNIWMIPFNADRVIKIGPSSSSPTATSTPTATRSRPKPPASSTPIPTAIPTMIPTPTPTPSPPAIFTLGYPYQDSGTMNMEINANYATWDDMGIKALPLLNDTVSISLTLQFYADIPKRSLLGAIPANTQSCGAIRSGLNTAERVPPHRDSNVYQSTIKPQIFTQTNNVYRCYFEDVWKRAGGISRLGYPVSEAYVQTDPDTGEQRYIQYAERGRLEQPVLEDGSLGLPQFGLLGAEYLAQQDPLPVAVLPVAPPSDPAITYFVETRHTLQGKFAEDFYDNGGLELNGYPLTEPFIEMYPDYPYAVTVQYFERVRMEYHGDPADPLYGQITLGRIGAAVYAVNQP